MGSDDLPADVLRFLDENIDSVPHLEALLLLWEDPAPFSADQLAQRLYVAPDSAARIAQDLVQRRLARAVAGAAPPRWTFDPAWDPTGEHMPRIAGTYRRDLVRVANVLHSKASASVRAFARAFDLKQDE